MPYVNPQGFTAYGLSLLNGTHGFTEAGMQGLTGTVGLTPYGVELTTGVPQHGGGLLQQQLLYNEQQRVLSTCAPMSSSSPFDPCKLFG